MINIGITGGENIIAGELVRLLINHPDVSIEWVASSNASGPLTRTHKGLIGECDLHFSEPTASDLDLIMCCDHTLAQWCEQAKSENNHLRVIDLAGALHIKDASIMYGLCEINRKFMVHDCYDVVSIPSPEEMVTMLALIPLAKNAMISSDINVHIKCGDLCHPLPNTQPTLDNAHLPLPSQMALVLTALQPGFNSHINITSEPHAQPPRGITATVSTTCNVNIDTIKQLYIDYYDDHNFTFVSNDTIDPTHVNNTNKCLLHMEKDGNTLTITSVADALLKGAAGNAVHVMNLLFGLHELTGLTLKAQVY